MSLKSAFCSLSLSIGDNSNPGNAQNSHLNHWHSAKAKAKRKRIPYSFYGRENIYLHILKVSLTHINVFEKYDRRHVCKKKWLKWKIKIKPSQPTPPPYFKWNKKNKEKKEQNVNINSYIYSPAKPCHSIQQQHITAKPPSITIFSILLASERGIVGGGQEQGYTLCHILFFSLPPFL